jgi:hypothetical protein
MYVRRCRGSQIFYGGDHENIGQDEQDLQDRRAVPILSILFILSIVFRDLSHHGPLR